MSKISDELLAAFIDGSVTPEECLEVLNDLAQTPDRFEELMLASQAVNTMDGSYGATPDISQSNGEYLDKMAWLTTGLSSDSSLVASHLYAAEENFDDAVDRNEGAFASMEKDNNHLNFYDMQTRTIIGEDNPILQHDDASCAIKSQQLILQEFGVPVSEEQLIQWSVDHGLYNGTGTNPMDVGVLLNQGGIPTTMKEGANIFDLTNELAQGHKVIVGVDSGELWHGGLKEWWEDFRGISGADHALIVAGIDNTNPEDPKVLLTDPGSGEICKSYDLDKFMDAWKDSNCMMVSTDIAPAEFGAEQIAHNQSQLHLADVAGVDFGDFQLFHNMSLALPPLTEWDYNHMGYHPIDSLMQAYMDYGADEEVFQHLSGYDFAAHLNTDVFTDCFGQTFNFNTGLLAQHTNFEMSDLSNFLAENPDATALHDYFEANADLYAHSGDMELADFFHHQANFIDFCHDFGIDPVDAYDSFIQVDDPDFTDTIF